MKWTKALVCFAGVLISASFTLAPTASRRLHRATYNVTDYFPLNEGDTWRWREPDGSFAEAEVGGTVSLGGVYTAVDVAGSPGGSEYHNYYSADGSGLTHYGYCDPAGSECGLLDPPILIPNAIAPGWSQHFSGTLRNMDWDDLGPYGVDVTFVGVETVTVPAGTFTGCLRFHVNMDGDEDDMLYAPGVGEVEVFDDPPAGEPSELVAARVGGDEYGYYDSAEYFPLHEGDHWLYDDATTFFIEGAEWQWMHGAMAAFVHDDPSDPNQGFWWSNGDEEGVEVHGDGVAGQWGWPLTLLDEQCALGDRYVRETWTGSKSLRLVATVEGIEETVAVPAGTFQHCLRVKLEWSEDGTPTLDETWWLAPGVGRVKMEEGAGGGGLPGKGRGAPVELIAAIVGGAVYPQCALDPDVVGIWDLTNLEVWVDPPGIWVGAPDPDQWQHTMMTVQSDRRAVQRGPNGDWIKSIVCADPATHKAKLITVDASDPSKVGSVVDDIDYTVNATQWVQEYYSDDLGTNVRGTWTRVTCGHDAQLDGFWRLTERSVNGTPQATPDLGAIHENFADGTWRRDYVWDGWERGVACRDGNALTIMFLEASDPAEVGRTINATYTVVGDQWTMTFDQGGDTIQDTWSRVTCQQDPDVIGNWRLAGGVPPPDAEELGAILIMRGDGSGRRTTPSQDWSAFSWCAGGGSGFVTMTNASDPGEIGLRMIFDYAYDAGNNTLTITTQDEGSTQIEVYERVVCDDYPESVGTWTEVASVWNGWPEWDELGATLTIYGPSGHTWRYEMGSVEWMEGTACVDTTTHDAFFEVTDASDPDFVGEVLIASLRVLDGTMVMRQNEQDEEGVMIYQSGTCTHDANLEGIWDGVAPGDGYLVIDDDGTLHVGDPDGWWWVGPSCADGGTLTAAVAYCGQPATNGELYQDTYSLVGDTLTVTIQAHTGPEVRTYERTTCGHDAALEDDWELTGETVNGSPQFDKIGALLTMNADGTYREDYPGGDWHDGTWCLDGGEGFMRIETMEWGSVQTGGIIRRIAHDLTGGQLTLDYWYDDPSDGTTDHFVRTYARPEVPGDFDEDGDVDLDDLSLFRPYWGAQEGVPPGAPGTKGFPCRAYDQTYDLNDDGYINFWDFIAFWRNNPPYHENWVQGDVTGAAADTGCPSGYPGAGPDDKLDFLDLMAFAAHWHTSSGNPSWDLIFDFAGDSGVAPPQDPPCPVDDVVDYYDLTALAANWQAGDGPAQPLGLKQGQSAPQIADLGIGGVSVTADTDICLVGDEIEVTVKLADAKAAIGYDLTLIYEPSKLALVEGSVKRGDMFDGEGRELLPISKTNVPGAARFSAVLAGQQPKGVSGSDTLVTMRFTALEQTDEPPIRVQGVLLADEGRQLSAPKVTVTPLRIARLGQNDWRAELVAQTDALVVGRRFFGVIEDEELRSALTTRQAPADPALSLRFLTADGPAVSDYLGANDRSPSFRFAVTSAQPNAEVTLTVPDLRLVPKRYALRLTDEATGVARHLRTSNSYRFNTGADGGGRTFRLDVLDAQTDALRVTGLAAVPMRGGGTSIEYQLTADATTTIVIVNIAGVRVRRLESAALHAAGRQTAIWDGKSDAGTAAPAGTYMIRVRAASEDGQKASAVATTVVRR